MSVVLMYHALYRGDDTSLISAEDLPYAVSEENFTAQLDLVVERERAGRTDHQIIITFDDGHVSNHDIALGHLLERGLHAWFFVTTGFVGQRVGFCDEQQIAALAHAGMTIGSHGTTHAFFDDLDEARAIRELEDSREHLSRMTGGDVDSISFPGGRWTEETLVLAEQAALTMRFGSVLDTCSGDELARGSREDGSPIPRVAIRRSTTLEEFTKMVDADPGYFRRHRTLQGIKTAARAILGNRIYHGLYKSLS